MDFVPREEFKEETDNIYGKLNKHDRQISVLETLVENLKGLPSAINNLEKTMALMGQNLENLNTKFDKKVEEDLEREKRQSASISRIDEKSKVDILDFVKGHWWAIVTTIALVATLVQNYVVK